MDNPERTTEQLTRALGLASLALAVPAIWKPQLVAKVTGFGRNPRAAGMIRAVGLRELGHAVGLVAGPRSAVWTRVAGDTMDLALLGRALHARTRGTSRERIELTTVVVAGIAAVDLYAAVRAARTSQHGPGRPGPLQLQASVTVNRSPEEVYAYWRDFQNLPTFMLHLQSVEPVAEGVWRWQANAPLRKAVAWEAEVTGDEPGRRISWRSLPEGDVDNSGTVHFAPAPGDRGTEVKVVLHYDVPGGRLGRAVARLLGEEPEQQVRDDLRRFKQVVETGDVVRSDSLPHGTDARHQLVQRSARPHSGDSPAGGSER